MKEQLGTLWQRLRIASGPVILLGIGLHMVLGNEKARWPTLGIAIAGLLWSALPLFRRESSR